MIKKYYHATRFENLMSIMDKGLIPNSFEGITYLTEDSTHAAIFLAVRGIKNILVVEVELDEDNVIEQFDHNRKFFDCRAFGYDKVIPANKITKYIKFEL